MTQTAQTSAASSKVAHRAPADRAAAGRLARGRAPLASQAQLETGGRPDPIALLEGQAASRVPELVPIRYGRMVATPFSFYRGGALIMASDLSRTPNSGLHVQLCGDAHVSNFGIVATPERRLAFDVNDFDETHPGPFEWDVKRLAASLAVAGRDNGFGTKKRRTIVLAAAAGYREAMAGFAAQRNLAVWYTHLDMDEVMRQVGSELDSARKAETQAFLDKARSRDSVQALDKLQVLPPQPAVGSAAPPGRLRARAGGPQGGWRGQRWNASVDLYARICGQTLARAHARSGDRVAIAAYLGSKDHFDHAMADFAEAYADLNVEDHAALAAAIASGRITAQTGV